MDFSWILLKTKGFLPRVNETFWSEIPVTVVNVIAIQGAVFFKLGLFY